MEVLWNIIRYSISLMKCSLTSFTLNLMTLLWKHDFLWLLTLLVHSFNRHLFRVYYVPNTADCLPSYIFRCGVWVGIDGSKFFSVGQKLGVFFKWASQSFRVSSRAKQRSNMSVCIWVCEICACVRPHTRTEQPVCSES